MAKARKTIGFSYDASDHKWFEKLKREANSMRPKVPYSQLMVEILRDYFERKKLIEDINSGGSNA